MKTILLFSAAIISLPALAQTDTIANSRHLNTPLATAIVVKAYLKKVIKVYVTSLLFHNYHFVYKYYKITPLHKYPGGVQLETNSYHQSFLNNKLSI